MGKQPYIPFYVGDYIKDTRQLPLSVRGLWVDLILFMWDSPTRGEMVGTVQEIARIASCEVAEAQFALNLLQQKKTADIILLASGEFKIISRRMKRDAEISKVRSEVGKKGVAAKFANGFASPKVKAKGKQNPEYDNEVDNDNEIKKNEGPEFQKYIDWTDQILDGNSQEFEVKIMNERIPVSPNIDFWVRDHLGLLERYPKMRPPDQHRFIGSVMKHVRENYKKPVNGNGKSGEQLNRNQQHTASLINDFKKRHGTGVDTGAASGHPNP